MNKIILVFILHTVTLALTLTEIPKLVFVQTILRHGQKYPDLSNYQPINKIYSQKQFPLGYLTNQGKAVHYLMGKKMYQVYWKKLFSGTPYENQLNQTKVVAKSIDFHRIIQSGQAHMFGLLQGLPALTLSQSQAELVMPPYPGITAKAGINNLIQGYVFGDKGKGYQTMPINLVPVCQFSQHWKRTKLFAYNFKSNLSLSIQKYPPFQAALREFEKSLNLTNGSMTFSKLHSQMTNQLCQISLGKTQSMVNKPSEAQRSLITLHNLAIQVKFYTNELQMKVDTGPLYRQLIGNINNYTKDKTSPQWVIFSSQQIEMGMMLAALKIWTTECIFENYLNNVTHPDNCIPDIPPFGSVLAFEVYEYLNQTYTFKINYNGKYLKVPLFGNKTQCLISQLQAWFDGWKVSEDIEGCLGTDQYIIQRTQANGKVAKKT